jgi:hypothetical protein
MVKQFSRVLIVCLFFWGLSLWNLTSAIAQPLKVNASELSQAVQEIEALDAMRSGLASTLEGQVAEPTGETFKQVCKPVGMRAKQLSQENGWQVKQIANKYRNPAHAPDNLHAKMALAKFEKDPELTGFWQPETLENQPGIRYYRRINVEASCLACHGQKENRPQFITNKYPQDLAYNFKTGDLRGMYSVFIPELQAALQNPPKNE